MGRVLEAMTNRAARFSTKENGKVVPDRPRREMKLTLVTPDLATSYLNHNNRNRPLNPLTVWRYSQDLLAGSFLSTAQPIVFDWNGDLLDGQHRLWAIVESGVSAEFYVATGEDPATFKAYDRGRKRTAADVMSILGHKNTNHLAAVAGKLNRYQRGVLWSTTQQDRYVSIGDHLKALEDFPGLDRSIASAGRVSKLASLTLAAFLHYLFAEKDEAQADWFYDALAGRVDLQTTDAAHLLRERLIQNRLGKAKLPEKEVAALFIKAWNHYRQGKGALRLLRWRGTGPSAEAFPEIM